MPRQFTVINFPQEIKDELSSYIKALKFPKSGTSLIRPENYHLTLRFWGDSDPIDINAGQYQPFKVKINNIGGFPSEKRPKYLVAFLETSKFLTEIAKDLGEKNNFRPHITLARIRKKIDEKYIKQLNKIDFQPIEFNVEKIDLMSSQLGEDGSIYSLEKEYLL